MQHGDVWRGLDLLARNHGLSTSGLAKLAGLDATAFNKSKRVPKDGRPRWPSTESISRVLDAVGVDFVEFAHLVTRQHGLILPLVPQSDANLNIVLDQAGRPVRAGSGMIRIPKEGSENDLFVLEVGSEGLGPAYRSGDHLMLSCVSPIRQGDRVIFKPIKGEIMAKVLGPRSETHFEVRPIFEDGEPQTFANNEVSWISRVLSVRR